MSLLLVNIFYKIKSIVLNHVNQSEYDSYTV